MAIRINNTTVIDDSRNAVNIPSVTFSDGTVQRTAAPVFGDTVTAGGSLLWTLNNPNAYDSPGIDSFGRVVAISGNFAIVGAHQEDDAAGGNSGKAYIFNVTTGALVHTLNNPNPSSNFQFGYWVAASGNYAAISAWYDGGVSFRSGKVYIFNITTGQLVWTLNNPNAYSTSQDDQFGNSVAMSGNYLIIGASFEDDVSGTSSGKAYIFNVTTGALVHTLNNPNAYSTSQGDNFGQSVSISGNYAIVGAYTEDDAGGTSSGKAYIYNVTTGTLIYTLNNPNSFSTGDGDFFGISVEISGNYAIVGAYGEDSSSTSQSGRAYIFNVTTGQLVWTLVNPSPNDVDWFGLSVSISDNYAVVGARDDTVSGVSRAGRVYVYNVLTGSLIYTLDNPGAYSTNTDDQFGCSVAISGNNIIVGEVGEDIGGTQSGIAFIFNIEPIRNSNYVEEIQFTNGTTLNLLADKAFQTAHSGGALIHVLDNPNVYSTSVSDQFGWSVSISGNYAIVGAYLEDEAGIQNSGRAYIFNVITGQLLYTLNNPNAYSGTFNDDYFGFSVAISGNFAIVGAYTEDESSGLNSGKAYIFNVTTGQLVWTLNNPNTYSTVDNDYFAYRVAISGNYAIVGAYQEDDAAGTGSGKAYIYNLNTGTLLWTLNNPNPYGTSTDDSFSWAIAISGNYAIVGAHWEYELNGITSGKAYIYNVATGQLIYTLNNPNAYSTADYDEFGFSVAINENYAVVCAHWEADAGGYDSGKAYVYSVTTGQLLWTLNNPNAYSTSQSDNFGQAASLSGKYAIISAHTEDDAGGTGSGKAYIFDVTTGQLVHVLNNPTSYGTSGNDFFGFSVGISGNFAIVGAYLEDDLSGTPSGKAYIFSTQNLTYLDKILTVAESIF